MLIQFKSLTFPQLHLVDLVGSVKTDGFFYLFIFYTMPAHPFSGINCPND